MLSSKGNEVCISALKGLFSKHDVLNATNTNDRHINHVFYNAGPFKVKPRRHVHSCDGQIARCGQCANRGVNKINASLYQLRCKPCCKIRAIALPDLLADRDTYHQREVRSHRSTGRPYYLKCEPRPVLIGAAVFISALVGKGRQKLVNQVPVGPVNFNSVKARLFCPGCACGKGLYHLFNSFC